MKRDPILTLLRSIFDAATNPMVMTDGLAVKERLRDIKDILKDWYQFKH